jgi:hypothetical protein
MIENKSNNSYCSRAPAGMRGRTQHWRARERDGCAIAIH